MEKKTAISIASALFPHYPSVAEFHITSDEQPFFNAVDASNHAKGLKDGGVIIVSREELANAKKVVKEPTAPVVLTSAAPVVETPVPPVVETPVPPVVETPVTPVVETPVTPVVETPKKKGNGKK